MTSEELIKPHRDFSQAIGLISDLIKDVMSENRQLTMDVSALRTQIQDIQKDLHTLNTIVKDGNGSSPMTERLSTLETTAQHIEENLERNSSLFHTELKDLQSRIDKHLEDLKETERKDKDKAKAQKNAIDMSKFEIDRNAKWKVLVVILTFLLGILSTLFVTNDKKADPKPSNIINAEMLLDIEKHVLDGSDHKHIINEDGHIQDVSGQKQP